MTMNGDNCNNCNNDSVDTKADVALDTSTLYATEGESFAFDTLQALLDQEGAYRIEVDYISIIRANTTHPRSDRVGESWRRKLCEWCYEVVDHFGFDREVVSIALNFLDRAVAIYTKDNLDEPITQKDFQLLAVTSLFTAIKLHGESDNSHGPRRKLRIDAFVELSRKIFDVEQIENTEQLLLDSLQWRVNPPTMLRFISHYLNFYTPSEFEAASCTVSAVFDVARYFTELAVCVFTMNVKHKVSAVSYAAILCALQVLHNKFDSHVDINDEFLTKISQASGYRPNTDEIVELCQMIRDLCPSMFKSGHFISTQVVQKAPGSGNISPVSVMTSTTCAEESSMNDRKRKF